MSESMNTPHGDFMLKQINYFWQQQEFCDVTICVENSSFKAHRLVLSAASGYFQGMFLGNMIEKSLNKVEIHGITKESFSHLLNYIYTGVLNITTDNCQELLAAADMLGLSGVVVQCCEFLRKQLDPSNCLGISMFAERHGCYTLKQQALSYLYKHFLKVIHEDEFLEISNEQLIPLLQSEYLQIDNEFQVLEGAMRWILHNLCSRRRYIFVICNAVRFPIIPNQQLKRYIDSLSDLSLQVAVKKFAQDFQYAPCAVNIQHQMKLKLKSYMYQPRKFARKCIYMIGGYSRQQGQRWSDSRSLADVHQFTSFEQSWHETPSLHQNRSGHGVCVLNGKIYVVGGESDSLIFDSTETFDPIMNKWEVLASLTVPRCGLSVCALDGAIYAIAGWIGSEIGATVEKFNPDLNYWHKWDRMSTLRFAMGATSHDGLIYLVGGISDLGTEMALTESYNPVTKECVRLENMNVKRAYVGVTVVDKMLYAVGGWNDDSGALKSVERLNIDKNKWESVPDMSVPRAGAAVASVNGVLYVIGGRTSTSDSFTAPSTLASVECYDPSTESWFELDHMPISRCEAAVAVL